MQAEFPRQCSSAEPDLWRPDEIEEGTRCSVLLIRDFNDEFTAYNLHERNAMPDPGGWKQQPARWVSAMQIIGGEAARIQRERMEKLKAAKTD